MSRGLVSANETAVNASHVHEVVMVKLEFDTPVYAHSGIGTITYDGNDYLGVGDFGGISNTRESEALGPSAMTLSLSGVDSTYLSEGLNSGNMYDTVTVYVGYRNDDGTLVADPWIAWKGWLDSASIKRGVDNVISMTCQHDLAVLEEKDGSRFTDEDQQNRYTGDLGFGFVQEIEGARLFWGGSTMTDTPGGGGTDIQWQTK